MSTPDPLVDLATLTARVLTAAVVWLEGWKAQYPDEPHRKITPDSPLRPLQDAVEAFLAAHGPRALTWGQVPAGWEVQAPDGQWYRLETTRYSDHARKQMITMLGKEWSRDPAGPVTARPGVPNPTDAALAALGWPQVLEDGS